MPPTIQELGLDRLSIDDRLAVADAIWGSVAREAEAAPSRFLERCRSERLLSDEQLSAAVESLHLHRERG